MQNEVSGTVYGHVIQARHIDRVEVHLRSPVRHLRQLPPAAPLIGRSSELVELRSRFSAQPSAIAVTGQPWVGKSALAVAFAHEIMDEYPEGQIYLDFGGNGGSAASVEESLRWVLHSFGMGDAYLPEKLDHLVAAYRSVLAEKRVLVVLDNVADPTAVDVFSTNTGLVLATCRGVPLVSDRVSTLSLNPLGSEDATTLLLREAGGDVGWHGDDAGRLTVLCGGLPLALAAVANRLRATTYSPSGLADLVVNRREPLSTLAFNGATLSDSLLASYRRLPETARRAFRRLGPFPGETISSRALELVTGFDVDMTRGVSRALIAEGLLVEHWRGGTAELPVPFRLLAEELVAAEDGLTTAQVLDEILDSYVKAAQSALASWIGVHPPGTDDTLSDMVRRGGRGFFIGESKTLLRLLKHAAGHRLDAAVGIAVPLIEYAVRENGDLDAVHELALRAVTELTDDHRGAFDLLLKLNALYIRLSRSAEAADCLVAAQRIARDARDNERRVWATRQLLTAFEQRLAEARHSGEGDRIANSLVMVAGAHRDLGDLMSARHFLLEALIIYRTTASPQDVAEVLNDLGDVCRTIGQLADSVQFLQESVHLFEQVGDREGTALALESLADTLSGLGRHPEAAAVLERSDALLTNQA
ncbi:tetratricopeptide repeat protein [Actinophytocola sp.]|uniref:tetratricopeptide repeat protein n=1 Tax=Actinophytocola sp. TaxID=1872138 RepID=UPI002ED1FD2E